MDGPRGTVVQQYSAPAVQPVLRILDQPRLARATAALDFQLLERDTDACTGHFRACLGKLEQRMVDFDGHVLTEQQLIGAGERVSTFRFALDGDFFSGRLGEVREKLR